jgi:predicted metal-dependent hydrolase
MKPKDRLEYVIVHEMAHLLEPAYSVRFVSILDEHFTHPDSKPALNSMNFR